MKSCTNIMHNLIFSRSIECHQNHLRFPDPKTKPRLAFLQSVPMSPLECIWDIVFIKCQDLLIDRHCSSVAANTPKFIRISAISKADNNYDLFNGPSHCSELSTVPTKFAYVLRVCGPGHCHQLWAQYTMP